MKQLIAISNPTSVALPSDENTIVRLPSAAVETIVPGNTAPEASNNSVAAIEFPLYTFKKSKPNSVANDVKSSCTNDPGVEG